MMMMVMPAAGWTKDYTTDDMDELNGKLQRTSQLGIEVCVREKWRLFVPRSKRRALGKPNGVVVGCVLLAEDASGFARFCGWVFVFEDEGGYSPKEQGLWPYCGSISYAIGRLICLNMTLINISLR